MFDTGEVTFETEDIEERGGDDLTDAADLTYSATESDVGDRDEDWTSDHREGEDEFSPGEFDHAEDLVDVEQRPGLLATVAGIAVAVISGVAGRFRVALRGDRGMSTVEYALGTIAAAAFGAVLYVVVTGDSIPDALGDIIDQALNTSV